MKKEIHNPGNFKDYPYIIHTGRELELMLEGSKPLAVFSVDNIVGDEKFTLDMVQSGQEFSHYVEAGKLNLDQERIDIRVGEASAVLDYYAYTLPNERWRAQAYFMLIRQLHRDGWCKNLERLSGSLLGYSDEENDYHISQTNIPNCKQS